MEALLQTQQKQIKIQPNKNAITGNEQTLNKLNLSSDKTKTNSQICKKNGQEHNQQIQDNAQRCQVELSNLQNAFEKYSIFKSNNSKSIKQSDIMVDESDEYLVSFVFSRFGLQNQTIPQNSNTKFDYSNLKHQDSIQKSKPSQVFNLTSFKEDLSINPIDINGLYNLVGLVDQNKVILYYINQKQKNEIKINYDSIKSTTFNTCIKFSEDQQNFFAISDSEGAVVLYDLVNLQQIGLLQKQNKCVRVLNWQSPFVLTAAGKNNVHKFNVRALSWSSLKSNHFITGGGNEDGTLKLWDYHTQKNIYSVQTQNQITNILTPQNKFYGYFTTTYNSQSNPIEIWIEQSGSILQKKMNLVTEQQKILYGAISKFDDRMIASSSNGITTLWESFN